MSLERFINIDDFLINPQDASGIIPNKWTERLTAGGKLLKYPINFSGLSQVIDDIDTEVHLYSADEGKYVSSLYGVEAFIDPSNKVFPQSLNSINIPTNELIENLPSLSGNHLMIVNMHQSLAGTYNDPAFKIQEISTDRRELYLRVHTDYSDYSNLQNIKRLLINTIFDDELDAGNIVLNFGENNIHTVINVSSWEDTDGMIVKLLKPL